MSAAGASPVSALARDMESRIGDAPDGLEAVRHLCRSDDWTAGPEKVERLRSAIEWTANPAEG